MEEGNKNTRLFHLFAKIRGCSKTIDHISFEGRSLTRPQDIKEVVVQFCSSSFQSPRPSIHVDLFNCDHQKVSPTQNIQLLDISKPSEIKEAIFSLGN